LPFALVALVFFSTSEDTGGIVLGSAILLGGIIGIVSLILGIISLSKIKKGSQGGKGFAITAIAINSIVILISAFVIIQSQLSFMIGFF
ncbi:MAG: hypothetical protein AAB503_02180, partial [Patescibacteria group bacterium]